MTTLITLPNWTSDWYPDIDDWNELDPIQSHPLSLLTT